MKNILLKLFIFATFFFFPFINVKADIINDEYRYEYQRYDVRLYSIGIYNVDEYGEYCVSSGNCYRFDSSLIFPLAQAYKNGDYIHVYYSNINNIPVESTINHTAFLSSNNEIQLSDSQLELLDDLLTNSPQINQGFYENVRNASLKEKVYAVATQILVWEIVHRGRTTFDEIEPDRYNYNDSFYHALVKENKRSDDSLSLYTAYKNIIENIQNATNNIPTSISNHNTVDKALALTPNVGRTRYSATLNNVGSYFPTDDNHQVNIVRMSDSALNIYTNYYFNEITKVKLNYIAGNSMEELQNFHFFKFYNNYDNYYNQHMIVAAKSKVYEQKIYVKCVSGAFKILNVDGDTNKGIAGIVYQIRDKNNNPLKFNQSAENFIYNESGSTTDLVYNGYYMYNISGIPDGEYSLVEVASPEGYVLSNNESDNTTKIRVVGDKLYVYDKNQQKYILNNESILRIANYVTKVSVIQSGAGGEFLKDVTYQLYDESKTNLIPLVYDASTNTYRYNKSGTPGINLVTDSNGKVNIQSLPIGKYYLRQVTVPDGYSIEQEWYLITISSSSSTQTTQQVPITSAKGEFNFYKIDEDGKYLTGGIFTLQKYNDETGVYEDVMISEVDQENSNTNIYKIDPTSKIATFKTKDGIATFQNVEPNAKYKIVELETPLGYQMLDTEPASAVVEINSEGYAKNSATIVNKKIIVATDATSNAELIVSIKTGQTVIKYGILIVSIILIIGILIILRKKLRK